MAAVQGLIDGQDMGDNRRTTATDVLSHTYAGILDLGRSGFAAQLLASFYDLIDTGRTYRVTTRFQASAGSDWNAPIGANFTFQAQTRPMTTFRKATGFQRKGGYDRKSIMQLEKVDVLRGNACLRIGTKVPIGGLLPARPDLYDRGQPGYRWRPPNRRSVLLGAAGQGSGWRGRSPARLRHPRSGRRPVN